jgi:hypothetical protein
MLEIYSIQGIGGVHKALLIKIIIDRNLKDGEIIAKED